MTAGWVMSGEPSCWWEECGECLLDWVVTGAREPDGDLTNPAFLLACRAADGECLALVPLGVRWCRRGLVMWCLPSTCYQTKQQTLLQTAVEPLTSDVSTVLFRYPSWWNINSFKAHLSISSKHIISPNYVHIASISITKQKATVYIFKTGKSCCLSITTSVMITAWLHDCHCKRVNICEGRFL